MPKSTNKQVEAGADDTNKPAMVPKAQVYYRNLAILFLCALVIRLWFNFGTAHISAAGVADASEYLRYATALSKLNFTAPVFGPEWKEFAISGPTFPWFLWLCTLVTGTIIDGSKCQGFLVAQSLVSALTVTLMADIARRLWDNKTGFCAGILAAIYPGFIVNSGRLYSETFATFLETAAIAILVRLIIKRKNSYWILFLLGTLLVALQLTRSSMILLSFCALLIVFFDRLDCRFSNWKIASISTSILFAGMAIAIAPWFIFEKLAFNKITPIVDRVGAYNLFIGTNTACQGFLTYPYPDGRGIEQKSYLQLTKEAFKKSPSRFIKLALDKPARLYKFPWNDFRTSIGPISFRSQVWLHQLIIILALFGLCLGLSFRQESKQESPSKLLLARSALLLVIALNLPYLAFITVPRYNLLAMPAIIILAAAGLTTMVALFKSNPPAKAPKVAAIAALFLFIYLRDDIRTPLSLSGIETASMYIVQGSDHVVRALIGSAAAATLFGAIFLSVPLLNLAKKPVQLITALTGLLAVVLCAVPQRANGRTGEGIITLNRPGEKLNGKVLLPARELKDSDSQWFLLVDSDNGQLFKQQFSIAISGQEVQEAAIPALTALDDWHYLRKNANNTSYLECSYIFDCLTQPSAISNSELRQWFAIPLKQEQLRQASRDQYIDIDVLQKSNDSSNFFASPMDQSGHLVTIPARSLYSWEKAFYGVENDSGFTDTRLDEKVQARNIKWTIGYKDEKQGIGDLDVNLRLLKVSIPKAAKIIRAQSQGAGEAHLEIPVEISQSTRQLITVETIFAKAEKPEVQDKISNLTDLGPAPELYMTWTNPKNQLQTMVVPGLPTNANTASRTAMSFIADLSQVKGTNFQVHCRFKRNSYLIKLATSALSCNPFNSPLPQELY